ncbi:MAG: D-alanine--D-alanine ligase [Herminiimonas sp.]|uniref:D-alanine--D-alanine ligase n=1 Tax=Herminiimonas sp. TaxID=1926289 RepID=UPI00271A30EF|nr:D-alanine--D-alanine ligase [Herminiimonas sp.]MDO9420717.1 D-alanine--D-alanine ligase [Herminiimonas sp.]
MTTNLKSEFGKVGVLFGGRSAEREVSLMSGKGVLAALQSKGVDAHPFDPAERSLAQLAAEKFDRVFIALHGSYGEDGTLQGALEQLGIPYTGPGVMASAIAMDKVMTKRICLSHDVPTPKFAVLDSDATTADQLQAIAKEFDLPLMLKAPHEGSTIGIAKVEDANGMQAGFDLCAKYDRVVLVEQFIKGRELTVPVIGSGRSARALPIVEIRAPQGNYDYQHKYFSNDTQYLCPAPLDEAFTKRIQALAVNAFNAVGCTGWSRVDFMIRESDNEPFLLEINTSPGMTSHSLVPMSAKVAGTDYEDLCVEILRLAKLELKPSQHVKGN